MCGIIALILAENNPNTAIVSSDLYEGLGMLQHRGQVCISHVYLH